MPTARAFRPPDVAAPGEVGTGQAHAGQTESNAAIVYAIDAECKELARLKACAALAGCSLYELADGAYLLCRGALSRELPDLRAVAELLRTTRGRPL